MSELDTVALQSNRHHNFHAHFPFDLRNPVRSRSHRQWSGHLRGGGMQEEDGVRHLRVELGDSRHALLACDALQHSPVGQRQTVGLRKLYVQSGCGGGCQQPVHNCGDCYCAVH